MPNQFSGRAVNPIYCICKVTYAVLKHPITKITKNLLNQPTYVVISKKPNKNKQSISNLDSDHPVLNTSCKFKNYFTLSELSCYSKIP